MANGSKSKGVVVIAAVFASSLFFGDVAHAASKSGTWRPSTGLSGMSPGAFRVACTEIYGGKATFEGGTWICEMPDGRLVACDVDTWDATSKNCRTYTPPAKSMATAGAGGRPLSSGPTTASR